jgi:hypothetical protein
MTGKAAPMKTNFRRQPRRSNSDRWRELLLGSASVMGREGIRLRIAHVLFNPSPRETYFGYLGLNLLARSLGFEFIINESDARFDVDRPSNSAVHLHEYRDGIAEPALVHVTNWRGAAVWRPSSSNEDRFFASRPRRVRPQRDKPTETPPRFAMRSAGCACSIASPHWQCVWLPPSANPLPFRAATIHNAVKRSPIPNPGNVVHILEHRTGAIRDAFLNDTGTVGEFLRHARAEGHEFEGLEPVRPAPVGLD